MYYSAQYSDLFNSDASDDDNDVTAVPDSEVEEIEDDEDK